MPVVDSIVSSIVGSVISSIVGGITAPPAVDPGMGLVRVMPEESKAGTMQPPSNWEVQIDGRTYPLSPGVQIRNELNMIVMPTMVQAPVRVRFQTDISGAVHRVWILSATEASLPENR